MGPSIEPTLLKSLPIDMGVKKLKRELKLLFPDMPKSRRNMVIEAYKKRSWSEYAGVMRHRGHFPSHKSYKTKNVEVTTIDEETIIKVKNGTKQK